MESDPVTLLTCLPDDIAMLRSALLVALAEAANLRAQKSDDLALIAHLQLQNEKLRRDMYGSRAERSARLLDQGLLDHAEFQLENFGEDAEAA